MKKVLFIFALLLGTIFFAFAMSPHVINHQISKEQADAYSDAYKLLRDQNMINYSMNFEEFDATQVRECLNQQGAVKFRVTNGADSQGNHVFVLSATDEHGNTLSKILEKGVPCPPYCEPGDNNTLGMK